MGVFLDCSSINSSQWETITLGFNIYACHERLSLEFGKYASPVRRPVLFFSLYLSQNVDDQIYTALSISSS